MNTWIVDMGGAVGCAYGGGGGEGEGEVWRVRGSMW